MEDIIKHLKSKSNEEKIAIIIFFTISILSIIIVNHLAKAL